MDRRLPWWMLLSAALLTAVLVPLAIWGAYLGIAWANDHGRYVIPAQATVTGDLVTVASANAGRVTALRATTGAAVRRGDPIADVEIAAPVHKIGRAHV